MRTNTQNIFFIAIFTLFTLQTIKAMSYDNNASPEYMPYYREISPIKKAFLKELELDKPHEFRNLEAKALFYTIKNCNAKALKVFLDEGIVLNVRYNNNQTILHKIIKLLIYSRNHKILSLLTLLLEHDNGQVLMHIGDNMLRTPLHLAVEQNFERVTELLLKAGADTSAKDLNGQTSFHYQTYSSTSLKN